MNNGQKKTVITQFQWSISALPRKLSRDHITFDVLQYEEHSIIYDSQIIFKLRIHQALRDINFNLQTLYEIEQAKWHYDHKLDKFKRSARHDAVSFKLSFEKVKYHFKRWGGEGWVVILDLERHKCSNSQVHWYNPVLVTVLDKRAIKDILRNFNMIRGLVEMKIYRNGRVDIIDWKKGFKSEGTVWHHFDKRKHIQYTCILN